MKSRFVFSTFCMLVAMTMATGAFAQGIFTLSAGSEARGRSNGYAEKAGGITLFLTTGAIAKDDEGTVVINYGVPITNAVGAGDNDINVTICSTSKNRQDGKDPSPVAVNKDKGTITITPGSANPECAKNPSINVDNVLLSLVGSGVTSVAATVTSTGKVRLGGSTSGLTVIASVVDPLIDGNVKVGQKLKLIRHTGEFADSDKTRFNLVITEAQVDSFDNAQLDLTFSGIPNDVEVVELDAWVMTKTVFENSTTKTDDPKYQIPVGTMSSRMGNADEDGKVTVYLTAADFLEIPAVENPATPKVAAGTGGMLTSNVVDVVVVRGSIKGADDEDLLPIDLDIQASVDLGPTGDEADTEIPRFDSDRTTPMTVIESTPSQTTLKVPYVVSDGAFDTGIAVANMSSGGSAQPGAITFDYYTGGTKMTHRTSASSPGSGLNASGMLMPRNTYAALLSELFPGITGGGYLIITTDFTAGDGNVFISDFAGFSSTGTVREPNN